MTRVSSCTHVTSSLAVHTIHAVHTVHMQYILEVVARSDVLQPQLLGTLKQIDSH